MYRRGLCPLIKGTIATRQIPSPYTQNPKSHKGNTTSKATEDRTVAITAADQVRDKSSERSCMRVSSSHLNTYHLSDYKHPIISACLKKCVLPLLPLQRWMSPLCVLPWRGVFLWTRLPQIPGCGPEHRTLPNIRAAGRSPLSGWTLHPG